MFDLLIKNALIYDGTNDEPYSGDIGIKGEKISRIIAGDSGTGKEKANLEIDAGGKVVCPGFIDIHSHDEIEVLKTSTIEPKVRQGITTVVNGNCGLGFFPLNDDNKELLMDYNSSLFSLEDIEIDWHNFQEYSRKLNKKGLGINVANLVGHGAIRIAAMGFDERNPTEKELKKMVYLLKEEIEQGVFGMSTGLLYPPGSYAGQEELAALCRVLAENDLVYTTHLRNESDNIVTSIQSNIDLARETGVSVEISHFNVSGRENWGKAERLLAMIREAREAGYDINCDQYPYQAGSTVLSACLPQWALNQGVRDLIVSLKENKEGIRERIKEDIINGRDGWDNIIGSSGWDNIVINSVATVKNREVIGKNLSEIAKLWGLDHFETLFKILVEEKGKVTMLIFSVCEEELYEIFSSDFILVGSDGIKMNGKPHPRLYGTYPRIISRFVREKGLVTLPEALRKMSTLPAAKMGLKKRGLLQEGYFADLVIFDYDEIQDLATYEEPRKYPRGIEKVIINGKIAFDGEKLTDLSCGRVLESR